MASFRRQLEFAIRGGANPEVILVVAGVEAGRSPTSFWTKVQDALRGLDEDPRAVTDNITKSATFQRWRQGEELQLPPVVDAYRRLPRAGSGNTHTGSSRLAHNTPQPRVTR